jgi:hypothetical protein
MYSYSCIFIPNEEIERQTMKICKNKGSKEVYTTVVLTFLGGVYLMAIGVN